MKKRFAFGFLSIFLILTFGVFGVINFSMAGDIVRPHRSYYFDDNVRDVEYPKACAGCGAKLLTIQLVPYAAPKEPDVIVMMPRGNAYPKRSKVGYNIMNSKALAGEGVFTELPTGKFVDGKEEMELYFVEYDPEEINFYYEVELGKLAQTSFYIETTKYRIDQPSDSEWDNPLMDRRESNGSYPFFVCSGCAKCDECYHSYSASNGFSIPPKPGYEKDTTKIVVGKYCEKHTCAFIWNVNNGNFNIPSVEGLDCKAKAVDGSLFCIDHTCKSPAICNKPVIGWNTTDSRSTQLRIYQGPDKAQYSNYCVDHFCKHYTCKEARTSATSATATFSNGKYINFPEYCPTHGNDCTIYGCSNPVINLYTDEKNKMVIYICEEHAEKYEELQKQAIELGLEDADKIPESDMIKDTCANCKKYLTREIKSTGKTYGKVIDGKWYCNKCATQNFAVRETTNDFTNGNEFSYHTAHKPTSQFADPATCNHSKYPVPNTVKFTNITKEDHTQVWTCINCNTAQRETYDHTFTNGECVCGYKQDGYIPPEDKEDEDNENNENDTNQLVEIANAKYVMFESETNDGQKVKKTAVVQLNDKNKVLLKIQKDKLVGLSYDFEDTWKIYNDDSDDKVPSKDEIILKGGEDGGKGYMKLDLWYWEDKEDMGTEIIYKIYLP